MCQNRQHSTFFFVYFLEEKKSKVHNVNVVIFFLGIFFKRQALLKEFNGGMRKVWKRVSPMWFGVERMCIVKCNSKSLLQH